MNPFLIQTFNSKEEQWEGTQKWYNLEYGMNLFRTFAITQPKNPTGKYIIIPDFVTGENDGKTDLIKFTYLQDFKNKIGGVLKNIALFDLDINNKLNQHLCRELLNSGITLLFLTQLSYDTCAYLSGIYRGPNGPKGPKGPNGPLAKHSKEKPCVWKSLFWMEETNIKQGRLRLNPPRTLLMSIHGIYPNQIKIKKNITTITYLTDGEGFGAKFKLITKHHRLLGIKILNQGANFKYNDKIIFKNVLENDDDLVIKLGVNDIENIGKPSKDYLYVLHLFFILKYHPKYISGLIGLEISNFGLMGWSVTGQFVSRLINEFTNKSASYWVVKDFLKSKNITDSEFWSKPIFAIIGAAGSLNCYDYKICQEYCCDNSRNLEYLKDNSSITKSNSVNKPWMNNNYSCETLPNCKYYSMTKPKPANGNGCCPFFPFTGNEYSKYIDIIKERNTGQQLCKSTYENVEFSLNLGLEPVYNWNIVDWNDHPPVITFQSDKDVFADPWAARSYVNILNHHTLNRYNYECLLSNSNIHGLSKQFQIESLYKFINKHINKEENLMLLNIIFGIIIIIIFFFILSLLFLLRKYKKQK